jgi:hypothetical protein
MRQKRFVSSPEKCSPRQIPMLPPMCGVAHVPLSRMSKTKKTTHILSYLIHMQKDAKSTIHIFTFTLVQAPSISLVYSVRTSQIPQS